VVKELDYNINMNDIIVRLFSKNGALLFTHITKGKDCTEVSYDLADRPFFHKYITEWGCNMTCTYL